MLTFEGINNAHHQAHNFILVAGNCLHALKEHTYLFVCRCRAAFAMKLRVSVNHLQVLKKSCECCRLSCGDDWL